MFPTPELGKDIDFNLVYEPAGMPNRPSIHAYFYTEDTYLMLDALEAEFEELRLLKPVICLEIGSGSGCNITFLAKILKSAPSIYLAVDINPFANLATRSTGRENQVDIQGIRGSLCSGLRLDGMVDVLIFNPPYVPTETLTEHPHSHNELLAASWAGGHRGRYWIDLLLPEVSKLLSPSGLFFMVAVTENDPEEIMRISKEQYGLRSHIVRSRKARNEHLLIIKFYR